MYPTRGAPDFQQQLMKRPEFAEVQTKTNTIASLDELKAERQKSCSSVKFQLTNHQIFLRRFFSEHTPYRSAVFFHGTGVGKTCTAISIAEEYLSQPKNEDKQVIIVANQSVQANFTKEIFNIDQVRLGPRGYPISRQCTGMTYVEKVQNQRRSQFNLLSPLDRSHLDYEVQQLIRRRYDVRGYIMFSNEVLGKKETMTPEAYNAWLRETFSDRLVIVDEAHNVRPGQAAKEKRVEQALQDITKEAENMSLILMSATPMYDTFQEILWLLNLCMWNDKRTDLVPAKTFFSSGLRVKDVFKSETDSTFVSEAADSLFRQLCRTYISYIQGNDPIRFPFMLKPADVTAPADLPSKDWSGAVIPKDDRITFLPLVLSPLQKGAVSQGPTGTDEKDEAASASYNLLYPKESPTFARSFQVSSKQIRYAPGLKRFLSPELLPEHSPKIARILKAIEGSTGVIFVHSYYLEDGCIPIALALEEAGYVPFAEQQPFLHGASGKSKGTYALIAGENPYINMNEESVKRAARHPDNKNGAVLKIIIGSFKVSEGVDFSFIRQVHILEPWYNLSRIEQVIGRGLRNCSHSLLPFDQQNTTVYLHAAVSEDRETQDLRAYRIAERKRRNISNVLEIIERSAFDCAVMEGANQFDKSLLNLEISQVRSEDGSTVNAPVKDLRSFLKPANSWGSCDVKPSSSDTETPLDEYVPTSFLLERKSDIVEVVRELFASESIWTLEDILKQPSMANFNRRAVEKVLDEMVMNAVGNSVSDARGRDGYIERIGDTYAFHPSVMKDIKLLTQFERTQPVTNARMYTPIGKATVSRISKKAATDQNILEVFREFAGSRPIDQAFDTWDKLDQRYELFKYIILHASENVSLYAEIVQPRTHVFNVTVEGETVSQEVFIILNERGRLRYPYIDEDGQWNDNDKPIGPLARAIADFETGLRKAYVKMPDNVVAGFTEYDPHNKRFVLKTTRKKGDFRGRDCSTLMSSELVQLETMLSLEPGSGSRPTRCKAIDAGLRKAAKTSTDGSIRYFNAEMREILRTLRKSDFVD